MNFSLDPYLKIEQLEREKWELTRANNRLRSETWFHRAITSLLAIAFVLLLASITFGQATFHRGQTENEAMAVALSHLRGTAQPFAWRYLWLPQSSPKLIGGARFVLNGTINRTDRGITVGTLDEGRILAVNLLEFSNNFEEFIELAGLWELLASRDFYFHERNQLVPALVTETALETFSGANSVGKIPANFIIAGGDQPWLPCNFGGKRGFVRKSYLKVVQIAPPAAHVAAEQAEFFNLTGSRAAFLRCDDFVRLAFSTVDEGIYYELLGIAGLSLKEILSRAGAAETELTKFDPFNWGAVFTSHVTGSERAYLLAPSLGVAPEKSRGVFGLTFDFRNDNRRDDPLGTLFFFLLQNRFDAGEGIFILPNGFPYGILYDGQGRLQAVAPPEVATDPHDRTPHHQLQAGISCNRCHDLWWKDAGNNVRWALNNGKTRGGVYGVIEKEFVKDGLTQEQIYAKLSSSYRANIVTTLDESRRIMAAQISGACGVSAREAIDGATALYEAAAYGDYELPNTQDVWAVSPKMVFMFHGIEIVGEPTALELRVAFDRFFPPPPIESGVVEFAEVAAWRQFDYQQDQQDAPAPGVEHLRRAYSYMAAIRDLSSLEVVKP